MEKYPVCPARGMERKLAHCGIDKYFPLENEITNTHCNNKNSTHGFCPGKTNTNRLTNWRWFLLLWQPALFSKTNRKFLSLHPHSAYKPKSECYPATLNEKNGRKRAIPLRNHLLVLHYTKAVFPCFQFFRRHMLDTKPRLASIYNTWTGETNFPCVEKNIGMSKQRKHTEHQYSTYSCGKWPSRFLH